MTQIDPQIAFQMHFQKLMHDVFSQTNSCIQEVNDYMYQLQMNILLQTTQMQQQPQQQQCYMQMPQCTSYMPMSQMMPQQQWQYPQQSQINMYQSVAPTVVTPVVVQPPTPPPSVPKFVTPKVTVTPPPPPPIVKLRIKTKPKELEDGQLTPPSPITSNRNSLIDELRNSGGRKSLRKTSRKEIPKKEEPLPAWIRSRDREKRSSFNPPPNAFETLEALLLAKDHQKSMPNLRTLSRANSDERKS
uniref:Uncharacterized protein n=1 Tax=Panagrolaimus sp. ES5 TaxID=591445 RepID=A0AC34GCD1_9BILA